MAETVTGTTVGDVKYVVAYFDVNTNNLYDANGQLYGNNTLATFLDNEFTLELHYVQDISTSSNPEEWAVWDGLKDLTVSSTLAFDDNYLHAIKGTIVADASAGSPSVSVDVTDEINKDTLSRYGVLLVNPFGDEEDQLMIPYSSFQQVSGTTFSFIVDDAQGLEASVTKDSPVRVSDPLYMFINANDIYEANIPNRYEEGVFKFPVNVMSRKLLNALDYSGSTGVSGTMEHKIYTNKNTITGITVTGSATVLKRDIDYDEVAGVHIAGVKTTIGGDTVYPRDASHDTTNNGTAYYAWMNTENDTVAFYTKTTSVTVGTLLYDEMYFTQLEETVSALVDVVNPYLFCAWTNGATVSPTVYWTKGNEVDSGDSVYNVSGGTATVVSGTTASPNITLEPILFRTFAFPFIVRNLVDYGVSLTIPVEDIDWTKEYVISIIRNNMEAVNGKASEGAYGVVMIDGSTDSSGVRTSNIHVSDGVISVPNASATVRGAIQIATGEEVTAGESTVLAVTPATLKVELDKKQDNLTFTVPLDNSGTTVSLQYGDGLAVGVAGTTNANKLITNNATVEEILTDSRKVGETTKSNITDRVVEPHDLKGALSLGQAVDVSCPINVASGTLTWDTDFLGTGTWTTTTSGEKTFGFWTNQYVTKPFPKFATNLKYLFIVDITNNSGSAISISSGSGMTKIVWAEGNIANGASCRIAFTSTTSNLYAYFGIGSSASGFNIQISNCRQYEVTNLTNEAIQYLASATTNPNPDKLFRSDSFFDIRERYLVKSDMVNPWTYLIGMPTNSPAMTVASGLAYQLSLTDGNEHEITVDTFLTDAYGKDAHIQLLLANNSTAVFKSPLNLIDALTPNAAHNITVKFRAGQANVYVDDTDVGYVVTVTAGTENGSLYYGITDSTSQYIVFRQDTDNQPISEIPTIKRAVNIVGNGEDKTIFETAVFSSGSTFSEYALSNLTIQNVQGGEHIITGFYGGQYTNVTIQNCKCNNYSLAYFKRTNNSDNVWKFTNCTITGCTSGNWELFAFNNPSGSSFTNCRFINNGNGVCVSIHGNGIIRVKNCVFSNNASATMFINSGAHGYVTDCTFDTTIYALGNNTGTLHLAGTNKIVNTALGGKLVIDIAKDSVIDLTDNTASVVAYNSGPSSASIVPSQSITVSDSGTATVLYNDNGVTKSRTITGGGSNYIMRNNGAWGVPVTVASGIASGSLYDLLVNGTATDITFAPVVDAPGSTVALSSDVSVSRATSINGAGILKTKVAGSYILTTASSGKASIDSCDLALSVGCNGGAELVIRNCYIHDTTTVVSADTYSASIYAATGCDITGSTFTNLKLGNRGQFWLYGTYPTYVFKVTDCVFSSNTIGSYLGCLCGINLRVSRCSFVNNAGAGAGAFCMSAMNGSTISDCYFNNPDLANYGTTGAIQDGNLNVTVTISGCTFASPADGIRVSQSTNKYLFTGTNIINGTVCGAGTVEFANGSTVTSTIPSGSTIGTGVINIASNKLNFGTTTTLENVTITGWTSGLSFSGSLKPTFNNCFITGNSGSGWIIRTTSWNNRITLKNCRLTGNTGFSTIYSNLGLIVFDNSYTNMTLLVYMGSIAVSGNCTIYGVGSGDATSSSYGNIVIAPGSTVTVTTTLNRLNFPSGSANTIVVGELGENTLSVTETGSATVIFSNSGTTVSISGSGTVVDSTGLHS